MKLVILTAQTGNTTPQREWDYVAFIEDKEQDEQGLGATPEDAILDLMDNIVGKGAL